MIFSRFRVAAALAAGGLVLALAPSASADQHVPTAPPATPAASYDHDFSGDGEADVLALRDGTLYLYRGDGRGGFARGAGTVIGTGWSSFDLVEQVGDWDGNGTVDLLARQGSSGRLYLYQGNGQGGFAPGAGTLVGRGWTQFADVVGPGDWTGDGWPDVIAHRASDQTLWVYPNNTRGGLDAGMQISKRFPLTHLTPVGDWTGDGYNDLLAVHHGDLYLYAGNGAGAFARGTGTKIGAGWGSTTALVGPGSWTADATADLIARSSAGDLRLYTGNGRGGFGSSTYPVIGTHWTQFRQIL